MNDKRIKGVINMSELVTIDLCEGNPGALTFMKEAYDFSPFQAEVGFQRMASNGITGSKLYMLWNDCCDRNTEFAIGIMRYKDIADIREHINYENGYGISYLNEEE